MSTSASNAARTARSLPLRADAVIGKAPPRYDRLEGGDSIPEGARIRGGVGLLGAAVSLFRLVSIVAAVCVAAACVTHAAPIAIGFSGVIADVNDPDGVFAGLSVPTGRVDGVYTIDPSAGTISFDDGTVGQRVPSAGANLEGTYRYGGGGSGNTPPAVILFPRCFVGSVLGFRCVPGQGSDAYVLDLPPLASDGFVQSFGVALVGGPRISDTDVPSVLPPLLSDVDSAAFAWRFAAGDHTAVVTGVIDAIAPIPEPSTLILFVVAAIAGGAHIARSRRGQG